jgi:hypothetical protein
MYYQLWCGQNNQYMATGRNSKTKEEMRQELLSYIDTGEHGALDFKKISKYTLEELADLYEFEIHKTKKKMIE